MGISTVLERRGRFSRRASPRRFSRALHLALFMDARHDGVAIVPRHARTACETPPSSNGSRRAVSPDTCLLALGRCEGFDVARLCHLVRKLCPALAE
jgi:hypothetical protein